MTGAAGVNAIAGGVRGQLDARMLRVALEQIGGVGPDLHRAVDTLETQAGELVRAGVEARELELLGTLVDLLG